MPIDPNIALQTRPIEQPNLLAMYGQLAQIQNARQQNKLTGMQLDAATAGAEEKAALRNLLADPGNYDATGNLRRDVVLPKIGKVAPEQVLPYSKSFSDQEKAARDAEKSSLEMAMQKQATIAQYAGAAKDQNSWSQAKQALGDLGIDVSGVPDQYDPAIAQQFQQRALTGVQQLDQVWKSKNFDLEEKKFAEQKEQHRKEIELKQRMIDAVGGKEKPLTESQGNAALFGARAAEADKILTDIGGDYSSVGLSAKQSVEGVPIIGSVANAMLPENAQKVDQAQRNFINAVLRKESGAAISPGEFESAKKQYFPQTGDSEAVKAQKAANRKTAIKGLNVMAGPGAAKMGSADSAPRGVIFFGFE